MWLRPDIDQSTEKELDYLNTRSMGSISTITLVIESIVLVIYLIVMGRRAVNEGLYGTVSVFVAVVVCGLTAFLSKKILKRYKETGEIDHKKCSWLLVVFYLTLTVWGMFASFRHYMRDEQIVTFYIVEFCFVCFFAMKPKISIPMILGTYSGFFISLALYNRATIPNPVNYAVFMLLAAGGTITRYRAQIDMIDRKYEVEKLNVLLKNSALHDELTGMKNRHALREDFGDYEGKDLDVIMIDIDYFKHFNDSYGHLEGDAVIREISDILMDAFTKGSCYRYGGDEFLILLPQITKEEYEERMQRWNDAMKQIRVDDIEDAVTCSSGHVHGRAEDDEALRMMIRHADELLYDEKNER